MLIDVWADIACPWCYIGERRLAKARAQRPDIETAVRWMPFQLQPDLPAAGLPWSEFAPAKFGGWEQANAAFARVAEAGAADGIEFRFDRITRAPNTAAAHRLVLLAQERGAADPVIEALFAAYFTEGLDVADPATLRDIAARSGLDADEAAEWLESGSGSFEVEQAQRLARGMGVTGVPLYIFDGRFALSGAQPGEEFVAYLDVAAREVEPGEYER
jgi:predicted DsbA family dithiol-disulfide isomerase